jgi:hypothetical protein
LSWPLIRQPALIAPLHVRKLNGIEAVPFPPVRRALPYHERLRRAAGRRPLDPIWRAFDDRYPAADIGRARGVLERAITDDGSP